MSFEKFVYSNAPSLLPFLPFRVSSLLWTYPTPSAAVGLLCSARGSHVHALPSLCTQLYITPDTPCCSCCRLSQQDCRLQLIREAGQYHWCNEASLQQLTQS